MHRESKPHAKSRSRSWRYKTLLSWSPCSCSVWLLESSYSEMNCNSSSPDTKRLKFLFRSRSVTELQRLTCRTRHNSLMYIVIYQTSSFSIYLSILLNCQPISAEPVQFQSSLPASCTRPPMQGRIISCSFYLPSWEKTHDVLKILVVRVDFIDSD